MAKSLFNGHDVMPTMLGLLASLWTSALVSLGIVTLVFVCWSAAASRPTICGAGIPSHLPDVKDAQPGPWKAAIEVALSAAFLLWWSGLIHLPYPTGGRGFRMEAAPIFAQLYWPILIRGRVAARPQSDRVAAAALDAGPGGVGGADDDRRAGPCSPSSTAPARGR